MWVKRRQDEGGLLIGRPRLGLLLWNFYWMPIPNRNEIQEPRGLYVDPGIEPIRLLPRSFSLVADFSLCGIVFPRH